MMIMIMIIIITIMIMIIHIMIILIMVITMVIIMIIHHSKHDFEEAFDRASRPSFYALGLIPVQIILVKMLDNPVVTHLRSTGQTATNGWSCITVQPLRSWLGMIPYTDPD